jgi:uncharacterized protein with von Willebrand factor type A (vWA) domain
VIHRDSDLLKNILLFSKTLRGKKVGVTIDNVLDALRGISFIDIRNKKDFYYLLKSNFISRKEESDLFDDLFNQFWSFEDENDSSIKKVVGEKMEVPKEKEEITFFEYKKVQPLIKDWADESNEDGLKEQKEVPTYSPEEVLRRKDFDHLQEQELEKVRQLVTALSRKLAMNLSRRWKGGKRGDRLDFRRTIRQSIKYGGEMIELKLKQPKPKPYRLILVGDVSGSMDIYSQFFLLFMYGIQNQYPYCETFVFSTRLNHITSLLKRRKLKETLRLLSEKVLDWSGGTNIGMALHQLHQRYSNLLHPNRTLFFIFSDGWDRGETILLDLEMRNLKRLAKRLIWLNPLLGSQNYQPLCKGMSTALPYLDHFLPCHNLSSLEKLGQLISKI